MENRSHQGASYTTFKDLASASSCPCHPPLQWGRSRVITDDDPKARSTARAHRAHSWQTRLFVSKDALPELPHLVSADNGLRIVLRLLTVAAAGKSRERDDLGGHGTGGHQTEGRPPLRHFCLRLPSFGAIPEYLLGGGGNNETRWYRLMFPGGLSLGGNSLVLSLACDLRLCL
ncbi:hypothetical protein LI328DRAFT_162332 [Trichoderma asperelloides]|nr:hypothetical protein LI328DRAFT_162332 [Trichoderma asperelloides]